MVSEYVQPLSSAHRSTLAMQAIFVFVVIGTVCAAFFIVWGFGFIRHDLPPSVDLIVEGYRGTVLPEPAERLVFLVLGMLVPLISIVLLAVSSASRVGENFGLIGRWRLFTIFMPFLVSVLFLVPFISSDFFSVILGEYGMANSSSLYVFAGCIVVSIFLFSIEISKRVVLIRLKDVNIAMFSWVVFVVGAILQVLSWRLVGIDSVTEAGAWSLHADPVFYTVSQVVSGKTVLVDFPSQYGLFPEMLAPLFRIFDLSIFSLCGMFSVLQLVSLSSLYFVLSKIVRIVSLRTMGGIALLVVTFETVLFFSGYDERYFQYWPIRFFWPALSVIVFYFFSQRKTVCRSAVVSVVGALGVLWNLDTGLFIVLAHLIFLLFRMFVLFGFKSKLRNSRNCTKDVQQYAFAIVTHVIVTIFVIATFYGWLVFKSGERPTISWIFGYQKIFYEFGLMMLPLPLPIDPWMSVLGVYLIGLLVSVRSWLYCPAAKRMDVVFYLSMLGLGLFVYYQGRSHVLNLVTVCWPAVMIAVILTDNTVRAIYAGVLPKTQLFLPCAAMSIVLVGCYSFISHSGKMVFGVQERFFSSNIDKSPMVRDELDFIRKYSVSENECLILSRRQGIYYAESGLASPWRGPGLVETVLKADQDRLIENVLDGDVQCIFLGVGKYSNVGLHLDSKRLYEKYSIVATNSYGSLEYLELIKEYR